MRLTREGGSHPSWNERLLLISGSAIKGGTVVTAYPKAPRAFYAHGGPRRSYVTTDRAKPGEYALPMDPPPASARCPAAILDSSPDGTGLGIWLLVGETNDACIYEYGGGIA
jgi:hypothetical protein